MKIKILFSSNHKETGIRIKLSYTIPYKITFPNKSLGTQKNVLQQSGALTEQ